MPRLIHLNGPTGVGKSTIAARYAADHPRTLNLDADEIVRLVGGWRTDFYGAVDLVRPLALSMAATHLASGHDVVMPQLIMRHSERDRFAAAATSAGGTYTEFVLLTPARIAVDRYRERTHHIDHVVEALGGERVIHDSHARIEGYLTADTEVIEASGAVEHTYAALLGKLASAGLR
ncbi:AAA family ATPase [Lentzea sp. JNUCC 0626]|uniref:AAA family ATPase n=1 Tax=Lentzea sp. JNUCC 0626 TaxID=3367513 RepID=UPI00374A6F9A